MSVKKWALIISFSIGAVNWILYTVLKFHWYSVEFGALFCTELKEYLMNISLGLFTGAALTFALSLKEYFIERKNALLKYYKVCRKWRQILFEVGYLDFKVPIELLTGYYRELSDNKVKSCSNKSLREVILKNGDIEKDSIIYEKNYKELQYTCEKELRDWLWENAEENERAWNAEPYRKKQFLDDIFEKTITECDEKIRILGENYKKLNTIKFDEVDDCYIEFDFLFVNKRYKEKILYNKVYLAERTMLSKMRSLITYIDYMNKDDMASKIQFIKAVGSLQHEFCETEENDIGEHIYHKTCFEIEMELYNILKKAYGRGYDKDKKEIPKIAEFVVAKHTDAEKL